MDNNKIGIFGFSFNAAPSVEHITRDILEQSAQKFNHRTCFLITPNASTTVYYSESHNAHLKSFYAHADYVLADGMPIVWLSKLKGSNKLPARLTGSDLFPVLWNAIKQQQLKATLVLSNNLLASLYEQDYNNCKTLVPKFFHQDDEAYIKTFAKEVAHTITQQKSQFLFLGLNFPKQEKLGIAVAEELQKQNYKDGTLILLLGASFEFYFGIKKRAPLFFQKTGLEWLYRFASEPRRLWKRYTVDNIRFLTLALKELLT